MNICGEHDGEDIAHVGHKCPACTEVETLNERIKTLEKELEDVESERDDVLRDNGVLVERIEELEKSS